MKTYNEKNYFKTSSFTFKIVLKREKENNFAFAFNFVECKRATFDEN